MINKCNPEIIAQEVQLINMEQTLFESLAQYITLGNKAKQASLSFDRS